MTEKSPGDGQGKGDSPTQQMPRVEADQNAPKKPEAETRKPSKPGADAPSRDGGSPGKPPAAADTTAKGGREGSDAAAKKPAPAKPDAATTSDAPAVAKKPGVTSTPAKKPETGKPDTSKKPGGGEKPSVSARQPLSRPTGGGAPTGGPRKPLSGLSKDEYTRTTTASPDATSVIPAVKDDAPEPKTVEKTETSEKPEKKVSLKEKIAKKRSAKSAEQEPEQKQEPKPEKKPVPAATEATAVQPAATATAPEPGRALLRLRYIEPWSVTRLAFVVSVALMIVAVVAMAVFWVVLQVTGVWGALNDSVTNILSDDAGSFDVTDYFGFGRLVGLTLVLSALNVVFMTALATIGAHLYNLSASILGGLKVTFLEDQR